MNGEGEQGELKRGDGGKGPRLKKGRWCVGGGGDPFEVPPILNEPINFVL